MGVSSAKPDRGMDDCVKKQQIYKSFPDELSAIHCNPASVHRENHLRGVHKNVTVCCLSYLLLWYDFFGHLMYHFGNPYRIARMDYIRVLKVVEDNQIANMVLTA